MTGASSMMKWLEAELARVEEMARAATPGPWEPEGDDPTDDEVYTAHDGEHGDLVGNPVAYVRSGMFRPDEGRTLANMRLIASLADPVAVLRRVATDRQILAEHQAADGYVEPLSLTGPGDRTVCGTCAHASRDGDLWGDAYPCRTVRLLAEAYGWTEEA